MSALIGQARFYYLFIFKIYLFIYLWLCWVFVAVRGLSLVAVCGASSRLWCTGFSLQWLLLLQSTGSRCAGFSSCGTRAQQLWLTGLVAPWHVGSSQTRHRTHVPCIGRWILKHCTTREVPQTSFYMGKLHLSFWYFAILTCDIHPRGKHSIVKGWITWKRNLVFRN